MSIDERQPTGQMTADFLKEDLPVSRDFRRMDSRVQDMESIKFWTFGDVDMVVINGAGHSFCDGGSRHHRRKPM